MSSKSMMIGFCNAAFLVRRSNVTTKRWMANSVSGMVYTPDDGENDNIENGNIPKIKLYTKEGCTLCDKVKDVLMEIKEEYPHSLQQVDITDDDNQNWFSKYKYDIPVLHINNLYWMKHRITKEEAIHGLQEASNGKFNKPNIGEPDAGAVERRQEERQNQQR